jgi:hypothetical protein
MQLSSQFHAPGYFTCGEKPLVSTEEEAGWALKWSGHGEKEKTPLPGQELNLGHPACNHTLMY